MARKICGLEVQRRFGKYALNRSPRSLFRACVQGLRYAASMKVNTEIMFYLQKNNSHDK